MNKTPLDGIKAITNKLPTTEVEMAIIPQPNLFSWKEIEADSDLNRLRLVLSVLPEESYDVSSHHHASYGIG